MTTYLRKHLDSIWKDTLDSIEKSGFFDLNVFNSWIKQSSLYDISDDYAIIIVPYLINKKAFEVIENKEFIALTLSNILGSEVKCQILMKDEVDKLLPKEEEQIMIKDDMIQQDYTFDNYIVGKSNQEANAAALNCSYNPGKFYNPLFIYGNSGLGKTHLLHAVGNYVKQNRPADIVMYIDGNDLISLIIEALKNKTIESFKNQISKVNFLLIDDIQHLAKSGGSQEIFFNIYNKLVAADKQIVLTSDIHPSNLKGIESRLISRFSSGLSVCIDTPEYETALAILYKKLDCRENEIHINDDVLSFIAIKFASDVRKLEGALNELLFKAILYNPKIIDLVFAKEIFKENPMIKQDDELSVNKIKKEVCDFYGLTKKQIESKSRTANIANARHIAVYLCRKHLELPFMKIGYEFGNRDHSTIMSSYEKIEKLIKEKDIFYKAVMSIENKLGV